MLTFSVNKPITATIKTFSATIFWTLLVLVHFTPQPTISPLICLTSWISLGINVIHFAWMAQMCPSSFCILDLSTQLGVELNLKEGQR